MPRPGSGSGPKPGPGSSPDSGGGSGGPGPKPDKKEPRLVIGKIGAPRGVRGDVKVHSFSGDVEHLLKLREVELVPASSFEKMETSARKQALARPGFIPGPPGSEAPAPESAPLAAPVPPRLRLKVLRSEVGPGGLTMAFEGYGSPEASRVLTGMEISVPRSKASPLGPGEWYIADLVGLDLVLGAGIRGEGRTEGAGPGEAVARVEAVLEGGPDPWLEVRLKDGGKALVPFRKEFLGEIDLEAGRIDFLAPWILE